MSVGKKLMGGLVIAMSLSGYSYAHGSCDDTALHENMEDLKTELKSLSFEVKKGNYDAADAHVATALSILQDARDETPYLFEEKGLSGDELAQRTSDYQSVIDDTIEVFKALDTALEAKDAGQIKSTLKEVGKMRKKGHRAFKAEC